MTDDTRRGRILEAVAIAVLTSAGTAIVEAVRDKMKKRKRKAKQGAKRR